MKKAGCGDKVFELFFLGAGGFELDIGEPFFAEFHDELVVAIGGDEEFALGIYLFFLLGKTVLEGAQEEQKVDAKRELLIAADRDHQLVLKLREKWLANIQLEAARAEEKQLEDFVTATRFLQTAIP